MVGEGAEIGIGPPTGTGIAAPQAGKDLDTYLKVQITGRETVGAETGTAVDDTLTGDVLESVHRNKRRTGRVFVSRLHVEQQTALEQFHAFAGGTVIETHGERAGDDLTGTLARIQGIERGTAGHTAGETIGVGGTRATGVIIGDTDIPAPVEGLVGVV